MNESDLQWAGVSYNEPQCTTMSHNELQEAMVSLNESK